MEPTQTLSLHVPLYVWPAVAVLGLAWIYVLLPERFRLRGKTKESKYVQLERLAADLGPAPEKAKVPAPAPAPAKPKWSLEALRALDAGKLNELICGFWQARACVIEPAGSDLLIFRPSTGRLFAAAHCTAATQKASLEQMQSLWELVQQRAAPLGLFYAVLGFAPEAVAFAKDKHLKLLTGSELLDEIAQLKPEQQQALLDRALARPLAAAA